MSSVKEMTKSNLELSKKLNSQNQAIYTDIVCYLRTSWLDELEVEEIIQEILGMLISAQQRGEDARAVIGEDYKAFCDAIIDSTQTRRWSLQRVIRYGYLAVLAIIMMVLGDLAFNKVPVMVKEHRLILDYSVSLGLVLSTSLVLLAAIFIVNYIGQNSFKLTEEIVLAKGSKGRLVLAAVIGGTFTLMMIISAALGPYVMFTIKLHYAAVVLGVLFIGIQTCKTIYENNRTHSS